MIHAREAREMMNNASRGLYEEIVEEIHKGIIEKSEEGCSYMECHMAPDLFEQYGDELKILLKESGYYVGKPRYISPFIFFMVSWKEESRFIEYQSIHPEQPKWWQFWK